MHKFQFIFNSIHNDAAQPWQLGFQDSASPVFSGLIELHNKIGFFLIVISLSVFWVLFALNYYYDSSRNPIAYKYLTHGIILVPTYFFKGIKHNNIKLMFLIYYANRLLQYSEKIFKDYLCYIYHLLHIYFRFLNQFCFTTLEVGVCFTATTPSLEEESLKTNKIKTFAQPPFIPVKEEKKDNSSSSTIINLEDNTPISKEQYLELNKNFNIEIKPVNYYNNMYDFKSIIIKDNKNKSGIYKFTNKLNGNFYIGSSVNLSRRFINYYSLSYISKVKSHLTISRAFIKYGYSNFELEILDYCNVSDLLKREQYYIDSLKPIYNIAKIAGSTLGVIKSKEQKDNISKGLKGKYVGNKSALFGRILNLKTKKLMSLAKSGTKNPLYGKTHSNKSKQLMQAKKFGTILSDATKEKIIISRGHAVYLYKLNKNINITPLPSVFLFKNLILLES